MTLYLHVCLFAYNVLSCQCMNETVSLATQDGVRSAVAIGSETSLVCFHHITRSKLPPTRPCSKTLVMQVSVKDRKIIFYIQACVWMQVLFILLPCSMGNNSNWLQNCLIKLVCSSCYLPADIEFCIVPQHRLFYSWITKKQCSDWLTCYAIIRERWTL